jgi:hypothetical protein
MLFAVTLIICAGDLASVYEQTYITFQAVALELASSIELPDDFELSMIDGIRL